MMDRHEGASDVGKITGKVWLDRATCSKLKTLSSATQTAIIQSHLLQAVVLKILSCMT